MPGFGSRAGSEIPAVSKRDRRGYEPAEGRHLRQLRHALYTGLSCAGTDPRDPILPAGGQCPYGGGTRSGGMLETQAPLERYANLQLDIGGKLFAKVTDRLENGWLLRFTARPPEFERWYESQS